MLKYDINHNPPTTGRVITSILGVNVFGYTDNPVNNWNRVSVSGTNQNYAQNKSRSVGIQTRVGQGLAP